MMLKLAHMPIAVLSLLYLASATLLPLPAHAEDTLQQAKTAADAGDFRQAAAIYQNLAAQGDTKAQFNLGQMYYYGDGVTQDYAQAISWYRKAADAGMLEAQYHLGVMYFTNKVIAPDYAESLHYYQMAAEKGHVRSQLNLGIVYLKGEVVAQDYAQSLKWLRMAARQGNGEAQFDLGNMYLDGDGVEADPVQAYSWIAVSAQDQADSPANRNKRGNMLRYLAFKMTPEQVAKGKAMADRCLASHWQECG